MPNRSHDADKPTRKTDTPRGLLDKASGSKRFRLTLYHPSKCLAFFVEHYWIVEWKVPDKESYRQESLPHPAVCMVVEKHRGEIFGVVDARFVKVLEGEGRVFGIKFWPGGFFPFLKMPLSTLTNRVIPLSDVFGDDAEEFEEAVSSQADDEKNVAQAETLLTTRQPVQDQNVAAIRQMVEQIASSQDITKVDQLVERIEISKRTLQRLFGRYVGVSPKWVIQRYRLHEAIERIDRGQDVHWARLAVSLGYFDQAHFIKHFRSLVGKSPEEYARSLGKRA